MEAWGNVAIGFGINFLANWLFLPMVGVKRLTIGQNFTFGMIMTVISVSRSYVIRRWFNGLRFGNAKKLEVGEEAGVGDALGSGGEVGAAFGGEGGALRVREAQAALRQEGHEGFLPPMQYDESGAKEIVYAGFPVAERGYN